MYRKDKFEMKILETSRCILRPATLKDAPYLFDYYSQDIVTKYLPFKTHKTVFDTKEFINNFFLKNYEKGKISHYVVVLKSKNKVIGNVGFNNIHRSAKKGEIGICINPSYWGSHLANELTYEIMRYGFKELDLNKIEAVTYGQNKYSQRPLNELGFKYTKTSNNRKIINKKTVKFKSYTFEISKKEFLKRNDKFEYRYK